MELADDHLAGRKIDIVNYEPRTLKSDLARHKRLSADESIRLGLSLTEALEALHARGLTHRDIKPSNIIFIEGVPKLADIGLVAASGQQSFVGTEGYVPPEGPGTAARRHLQSGQTSLRNLHRKRPARFSGDRFTIEHAAGPRAAVATQQRAHKSVRE